MEVALEESRPKTIKRKRLKLFLIWNVKYKIAKGNYNMLFNSKTYISNNERNGLNYGDIMAKYRENLRQG